MISIYISYLSLSTYIYTLYILYQFDIYIYIYNVIIICPFVFLAPLFQVTAGIYVLILLFFLMVLRGLL